MLRKGSIAVGVAMLFVVATGASADHKKPRTYAVTITNLTQAQILTPPVLISHKRGFRVFAAGEVAEEPLYTMAEEGDNSLLVAHLEAESDVMDVVGGGGIMPGQSDTLHVMGDRKHSRFSVFGMLATTNDAFFALQGKELSKKWQTHDVIAYDAGSEFNSEECAHIPGPPCGSHARMTDGAEGFIYVSNGVQGGADLDPGLHDWRNPVARISVVRVD